MAGLKPEEASGNHRHCSPWPCSWAAVWTDTGLVFHEQMPPLGGLELLVILRFLPSPPPRAPADAQQEMGALSKAAVPGDQPAIGGLRTASGTWDRASGLVTMKMVYPGPSVSLEEEPGLAACPPSLSGQQRALVSGCSMPDQMGFKCNGCQKENGLKILLLNGEENSERL